MLFESIYNNILFNDETAVVVVYSCFFLTLPFSSLISSDPNFQAFHDAFLIQLLLVLLFTLVRDSYKAGRYVNLTLSKMHEMCIQYVTVTMCIYIYSMLLLLCVYIYTVCYCYCYYVYIYTVCYCYYVYIYIQYVTATMCIYIQYVTATMCIYIYSMLLLLCVYIYSMLLLLCVYIYTVCYCYYVYIYDCM